MKRLRILTAVALILAVLIHAYKKDRKEETTVASDEAIPAEWHQTRGEVLTPEEYRRLPDQTYLTFPEWFLVYSPEEQAVFFKSTTSTHFSYRDQLDQFWTSYELLSDRIAGHYLYNKGYHAMIGVIGASTAVEYNLKSWYETVVGRVTNTATLSDEDRFNQRYTEAYAAFLHETAWYNFDFLTWLKSLWTETPIWGRHMHRKLERRYFLSSELLVKALYGKLLQLGARSTYGEVEPTTAIVTDRLTSKMKADSTIDVIRTWEDGRALLRIPRYTAFKETADRIAHEEVDFIEVAGNKSAILISLIARNDYRPNDDRVRVLFTQRIAADASLVRVVVVTPVADLAEVLRKWVSEGVRVEHVYDF